MRAAAGSSSGGAATALEIALPDAWDRLKARIQLADGRQRLCTRVGCMCRAISAMPPPASAASFSRAHPPLCIACAALRQGCQVYLAGDETPLDVTSLWGDADRCVLMFGRSMG